MFYVLIGLLLIICILIALGTVKQGKISDLEMEVVLLKEERENLTTKVNLLQRNLDNIQSAYEELTKIEKTKEENKDHRNEPPPTGDVDAHLDRLNKLSDKHI